MEQGLPASAPGLGDGRFCWRPGLSGFSEKIGNGGGDMDVGIGPARGKPGTGEVNHIIASLIQAPVICEPFYCGRLFVSPS